MVGQRRRWAGPLGGGLGLLLVDVDGARGGLEPRLVVVVVLVEPRAARARAVLVRRSVLAAAWQSRWLDFLPKREVLYFYRAQPSHSRPVVAATFTLTSSDTHTISYHTSARGRNAGMQLALRPDGGSCL